MSSIIRQGIVGLTTSEDFNIDKAVPTLGVIRKGGEKRVNKNGKEIFGTDLDHFRVVFKPEYKSLENTFKDLYGDKPTEFQAKLVGFNTHEVFKTGYSAGNALYIYHMCNGETQSLWWNEQAKKHDHTPKPCEQGQNFACGCSRYGELSIILTKFQDATRIHGKFILKTGSVNDIMTLFNQIKFLEMGIGNLMFTPVTVGRSTQSKVFQKPDGTRGKKDYSLLYIKHDMIALEQFLLGADNNPLLDQPSNPAKQLPATTTPPPSEYDVPSITGFISKVIPNIDEAKVMVEIAKLPPETDLDKFELTAYLLLAFSQSIEEAQQRATGLLHGDNLEVVISNIEYLFDMINEA